MKTQNTENEKHTPGPWKQHATFIWSASAKANIAALSSLRTSHVVGYVPPEIGDEHLGEIYANGRLISAAPDLLDALEKLSAAWTRCEEDGDLDCAGGINTIDEVWDEARAAIAKARGQQ